MKKIYPITTLLLFTFILFSCQTSKTKNEKPVNKAEKISKSEKIGFFTEKMNLTEEEAIHFWPIYNAYENKRDSIWQGRKQFFLQFRQNNTKIEDSSLEQFLLLDKQYYELKSRTIAKLRPFLSNQKILLMFYAEHQFKHLIIKRIRGEHSSTHDTECNKPNGAQHHKKCPASY